MPESVNSTVYVPGGRAGIRNSPAAPLVVTRGVGSTLDFASTVTPGRTSPPVSRTFPDYRAGLLRSCRSRQQHQTQCE